MSHDFFHYLVVASNNALFGQLNARKQWKRIFFHGDNLLKMNVTSSNWLICPKKQYKTLRYWNMQIQLFTVAKQELENVVFGIFEWKIT